LRPGRAQKSAERKHASPTGFVLTRKLARFHVPRRVRLELAQLHPLLIQPQQR
jgi:hypothetical protein